jgi:hypothetical protein
VSPPRTGLRLTLTAAGFAIGLTAVIALGLRAKPAEPSAVPSEATAETVAPTASTSCRRDPGTLPAYLANDPCPSAILAVELAVATVRLPIVRMVIEPGPLFCDVVWEGYGTPPRCRGPATRPGQFMHAYVAFRDTDKVAVVMLGLDLPDDTNDPRATRPPWNTTLVAVAVPPPGWVMP